MCAQFFRCQASLQSALFGHSSRSILEMKTYDAFENVGEPIDARS